MREDHEMTTRLTITTEFTTGKTERLSHEWLGWELEAAASVMRAQHHVDGGGMVYDLPLGARHREADIVRVTHEWTDLDRAVAGAES
ncbi:MAG: hypothetical protein L0G94_05860 [Brachybacterium sp.]|uniref:hypothetical protein n=1 Tax=Brachybacterium sp. TaxID=1891286 RepID=UPI0026484BF0|nr:hypothetical protein [Brachybacterium sp.]MDN5686199.1 hypothetical protein [Brachybacterium sp.]